MTRRRDDRGFTLIEVLLAVVITGIITVPLANVVVSYFRNTDETTARLSESHDVQIASTYWGEDVAGVGVRNTSYDLVQSVAVGGSAPGSWGYECGSGDAVVRLAWNEYPASGAPTLVQVAYLIQRVDSQPTELRRVRCDGSATPVSDTVIVHNLDPTQSPAVACTTTACTDLTLHIKDPKDRSSTGYQVTLTGQGRQSA